ncbi:MAG TPA: deoxyribodipyrimidine photo-lyase [Solirubrobacteraceae bacterium]|nr:deoxyribodipyrimidine photo-lyase [Solirubrobacteraceae bacterium]
MTALVWFRRDLRVRDHPALRAALERHEQVVPVFCLDDRLLKGRHRSGSRTQFLLECLQDLDGALAERGGRLVVRHGKPERELAELAREVGAQELHHTYDVSPYARARGKLVQAAMEQAGVSIQAHPGLTVADDVRPIRTGTNSPYSVFTPFYRAWLQQPRRHVLQAPYEVQLPAHVTRGKLPSLDALGLSQETDAPAPGGETEAQLCLERFLHGPIHEYGSGHDALSEPGTSRLSPYLRFGCVSPRALEARLPVDAGPTAFRRQLCWRDFYQYVLYHHPSNAHEEFQERYRGTLRWNDDEQAFTAWTQGRTGFPLVDAGMRQLLREGWMHNRARLVVGSFLTKDLGIDWRRGEAWFMRMLIDGDEASNNGNWQWIASVGTDPQPVFRRIYNPALHMQRFDPAGRYVREYVPELREVPLEYLGEPWKMPAQLQQDAGCVIGRDYPEPIVDRRQAREATLARYRSAAAEE